MVDINRLVSEVIVKDSASAVADRVTAAMERLKAAEDGVQEKAVASTRSLETAAKSFERLKASVDPVYAAQQRLADIQVKLNDAVTKGVATQAEADAVFAASRTQMAALGNAGTALAGTWSVNRMGLLSLQAAGVNAFQALASGMSPFRVAMTEGAQVLGALVQGGLLGMKTITGLIAAMGPFGPAAAVVASAIGGIVLALTLSASKADEASAATKAYQDAIEAGTSAEDLFTKAIKAGNEAMLTRQQLLDVTAAKQYTANQQIAQGVVNDLQQQLAEAQRQQFLLRGAAGPFADVREESNPYDPLIQQLNATDEQVKKLTADLRDAQVALTNLKSPYIEGGQFSKDAADAAQSDAEMIAAIQRGHDRLDQHLKDQWESQKKAAAERDQFILDSQIELIKELNAELDERKKHYQEVSKAITEIVFDEVDKIAAIEKKAADERERAAKKAADERQRAADREAELLMEPWKNMIQGIQDAWAQMFQDINKNGIDSVTDLINKIADLWKTAASQFVAKLAIDLVMKETGVGSGGAAGGGTDFISAFSTVGGATGSGSSWLDQLFGGGTGAGPGAGPGSEFAPRTGGYSYSTAGLSAAANLLPIGAAYASGSSVNAQQLGSGIGGAVGGAIGSIWGPVAGMAGSMVGSVAGGLLGGLFGGGGRPKIKSISGISVDAYGQYQVDPTYTKNGGEAASSREPAKAAAQALNDILGTLGATASPTTGIPGQLLFYGRTPRYQSQVGGVVNQFSDTAAGAQEAMADFITRSLKDAVAKGTLEGVSEVGKIAIQKTAVGDIDALNKNIAFAAFYDSLSKVAEPVTEASKAIEAIEDQFAEMRKTAIALGVALAPLDEGLIKAKEEYAAGFDKTISQAILAITDPVQLALDNQAELAQQRLREATDAGADLLQVERLNALERQKIIEQSISGLAQFYEQLTFGGLSGSTPAATRSGSLAAFQAALAQANAGDVGAQGRLQDLGTQFLTASRSVYASSSAYYSDLDLVRQSIAPFLTQGAGSLTDVISSGNQELARLLTANNNQIGALIAEVAALREDNVTMNAQLKRLLAA